MEELDQQLADAETPVPQSPPERRGPGRPPGSKTRPKSDESTGRRKTAPVTTPDLKAKVKPEPVKKTRTDEDRLNSLATSFSGLWDAAAEMFGDDTLRVTPQEAHDWANPVQRSLKQYGHDHHIEKLAPVEAIGQTVKIAGPRVKKIMVRRSTAERTAPPPPFRPNPSPRRAEPESGSTPSPAQADPQLGDRYDRPIPFDLSRLAE